MNRYTRLVVFLLLMQFSSTTSAVDFPVLKKVFPGATELASEKVRGGVIYMLICKQTFPELKALLIKRLGEGWVEIKPPENKPIDPQDEDDDDVELLGIAHFEHPKLRNIRITLSVGKGVEEGEVFVVLRSGHRDGD